MDMLESNSEDANARTPADPQTNRWCDDPDALAATTAAAVDATWRAIAASTRGAR